MSRLFRFNDSDNTIIALDRVVMFWTYSYNQICFQVIDVAKESCLTYDTAAERDADYERLALLIDLQEG